MITFKRLKDDDTALALYYVTDEINVRYEVDADLYPELQRLTWSKTSNSLVKFGKIPLALLIVNDGKPLGIDVNFINYIDGNKFNLRRSNLEICKKNTYITNGDETLLYIRSSFKHFNTPQIVKIDTMYMEQVKQYTWNVSNRGYVRTIVKETKDHITLQRMIIELQEGHVDPELVVDHIDHDKLNNTIVNLRQVTQRVNQHNRVYKAHAPGAILGVRIHKDSWTAKSACPSGIPGKSRQKSFSISKYGYDEALRLAIATRDEWEKELGITSIIAS